ncbi:hypothetical protein CK203_004121 [Vitis vinifera]|uniref:Chromo domain-containing protein n=1 Tax=Vitis vinifera TaxID=29760 RepID=A0A438K9U7_VITVI|nr:hypothetical protein CK203_004121 [Vitis vinifera]
MGHSRKNRRTDFLVQWKGTSEVEATWERDITLWQFETTVQAYWQTKVDEGINFSRRGKQGKLGGWWFKLQELSEEAASKPDTHHEQARRAPTGPGVAYIFPAQARERLNLVRGAMPCAPRGISHGHNAMARCYGAEPDSGSKQHAQAMGT